MTQAAGRGARRYRSSFLALVVLAIAAGPTAVRAQDYRPYFYPYDPPAPQPMSGFNPEPYKTPALRDAERLNVLLSINNKAKNVAIFINAQKAFHDTFLATLDKVARKYLGRYQTPLVGRILTLAELTLQAEEAAQVLLAYQQATTPSKVIGFYGQPVGAWKVFAPGPDRSQIGVLWKIQKNKPGSQPYRLSYGVVLHVPGGRVNTAGFLARRFSERLRKALEANAFRFLMDVPQVRQWIDQAFADGLIAALRQVQAASVLDFGFHTNETWMNAPIDQDTVDLPAHDDISVEVGDVHVVQIVNGYNRAVLRVLDDPSGRWGIVGVEKGQAAFRSVLDPNYPQIRYEGPKITLPMMIEVVDDPDTASQTVAPVGVLPPTPIVHVPLPPTPVPPPEPPKLPEPQPLPKPPPLPKICTVEMSQTDPDCIPH